MIFNNFFALLLILTLTSCAGFVENMHTNLERQESGSDLNDMYGDDYFNSHYRPNQKRRTSTEYNRPGRKNSLSTSNQKNLDPQIKRQYVDEKVANKRFTANDFSDQSSDGSLWGGNSKNSYLFTSSRNKTTGDIVQINVFKRLKTEISQELARAFPDNPYDGGKGKDPQAAQSPSDPSSAAVTSNDTMDLANDSSQDKISGVVVEEINREHILIKGRKSIVYKNKKRMVEVQALVSRRDISEDDALSSDSIIESNVTVVK